VEDVSQNSVKALNILVPLLPKVGGENVITKIKEIPSRHDEIYPIW
jgi:hypothetical protein